MMEVAGAAQYWLTRFCFQRLLAGIYLVAFLIVIHQIHPLIGERGLLPVKLFLARIRFWDAPSLFWINHSDRFLTFLGWCGLTLSVVALTGISERFGLWFSVGIWFLLWLIYLSFVNVGQIFYGYGWEVLLLEVGFLAIFLGSSDIEPPKIVIWLLRWVLFRLMFGAGLIKLRGDSCWTDLTCMFYHYETQPLPGPLSIFFHRFPAWIHRGEVLFNHFVELMVPWGLFLPGLIGWIAGAFTAVFQIILILSGNLSWLNYITLILCVTCFDDRILSKFIPIQAPEMSAVSGPHQVVLFFLTVFIIALSVRPAINLFSRRQLMNASFEPLHLVNTYGAFGSITKVRNEIILEGTADEIPSESSVWRAYEFKAKPGDPGRMPPLVSPYHYKIDWQMWFAAMNDYRYNPWLINLVAKLLEGDRGALSLIGKNPFGSHPPKYIRASLYEYHFPKEGSKKGVWWERSYVGAYLPPVSLKDPEFRELLRRRGWWEGE